uniref:Phospholipase B1, membrane-associated n=1 Tax=Pristhesancus plagipennis TaxID=1955184 RepID=A0A2K8JS64_PRIPG|nr:secreted Esterase/lipase protein [Pristhesancus plagipennis]
MRLAALLVLAVIVLMSAEVFCGGKSTATTSRTTTRKSNKKSRSLKSFLFMADDVASKLDQKWIYEQCKTSNRKQPYFLRETEFPCKPADGISRSQKRPFSVHKLRPGDVDVIAAMGDSLVAGNGAMEDYALGAFIESRGVSWAAGGDSTWHEYLTLPNIIKVFNPRVTGYSFGKAEFLTPTTALNVAFPVSADQDALSQAKSLVHKMKLTPEVDFQNDWKLVTMFFGANDICSGQCYNKEYFGPRAHALKLMKALDYLHDNLPRTLVNLVPVLDVSVSVRIRRSLVCRMLHTLFCSCFHRAGNVMAEITSITREYQQEERNLISSGRYNRKEDFTVVIQPFMTFFNAPRNYSEETQRKEVIDISYITHDCFHFSQKGHALAANLLWNNMLEPIKDKSHASIDYPFQKIYCPTVHNPYFFTYNNSVRFYQTGSQL